MAGGGTEAGSEETGQGPPRCFWHASRQATALCVACGTPVCRECARRIGPIYYCPYCHVRASMTAACPGPPPSPEEASPAVVGEKERRWLRADWGLKDIGLSMLLIFGIYYAAGFFLIYLTDNPVFYSNLAYALVLCPLIAGCAWYVVRRRRRGGKELGFQWENPGRTFLFGGLGGAVALVASYAMFLLIILIFLLITGSPPPSTEAEQMQGLGGGYLALVIVVVVILAPIFEELFFRGLLYPALRGRLGPTRAIIIDGVIFGALHLRPEAVISLILVGIILTYLYEKTESLAAPILAHALYNGAVVAITMLMGWPLF